LVELGSQVKDLGRKLEIDLAGEGGWLWSKKTFKLSKGGRCLVDFDPVK
jgi:hypothetical protein